MRILTNLLMKSSTIILNDNQDFPSSPSIGEFCFTGGILYIYATINGITSWFPITNKINYYVHSQGIASLQWSVEHNLGSDDLIFMVYDHMDEMQLVSTVEFVDNDNITLDFAVATRGKAIIFAASGGVGSGGGGGGGVTSVNTRTGDVTLAKADVGLTNVTNDAQVKRSEMNAASGVATLDTNSKLVQHVDWSQVDNAPVDLENIEFSLSGTNITVNGTNGGTQTLVLTGATAIQFATPATGTTYSVRLIIHQATGTHYNISWTGVKWANSDLPTITATDGAVDIVSCLITHSQVYCAYNQNFA